MKHLNKYKNNENIPPFLRRAIDQDDDLSRVNAITLTIKNNNLHMSDEIGTSKYLAEFFMKHEEEILNCYYNDVLKSQNNTWDLSIVIYSDLHASYKAEVPGSDFNITIYKNQNLKLDKTIINTVEKLLNSKNFKEFDYEKEEGSYDKREFKGKKISGDYYFLSYRKTVKSIKELEEDFKFLYNVVNHTDIAISSTLTDINDKTGIFDI